MGKIDVYSAIIPDSIVDNKLAIIETMVEAGKNKTINAKDLVADIMAHELEMETDVLPHIAIPHAKSSAVTEPFIVVAKNSQGIPWNNQNNVNLVIMIAVEKNAQKEHLVIISKLASKLADDDFLDALLISDEQQILHTIRSLYE